MLTALTKLAGRLGEDQEEAIENLLNTYSASMNLELQVCVCACMLITCVFLAGMLKSINDELMRDPFLDQFGLYFVSLRLRLLCTIREGSDGAMGRAMVHYANAFFFFAITCMRTLKTPHHPEYRRLSLPSRLNFTSSRGCSRARHRALLHVLLP